MCYKGLFFLVYCLLDFKGTYIDIEAKENNSLERRIHIQWSYTKSHKSYMATWIN